MPAASPVRRPALAVAAAPGPLVSHSGASRRALWPQRDGANFAARPVQGPRSERADAAPSVLGRAGPGRLAGLRRLHGLELKHSGSSGETWPIELAVASRDCRFSISAWSAQPRTSNACSRHCPARSTPVHGDAPVTTARLRLIPLAMIALLASTVRIAGAVDWQWRMHVMRADTSTRTAVSSGRTLGGTRCIPSRRCPRPSASTACSTRPGSAGSRRQHA